MIRLGDVTVEVTPTGYRVRIEWKPDDGRSAHAETVDVRKTPLQMHNIMLKIALEWGRAIGAALRS